MVKILGIETSCDETAAAVVDDVRQILSNVVLSQVKEHAPYGGVVPEIAARAHIAHGAPIITQAMAEAGCDYGDLDAIAVTAGPGLIGGLIVGVMLGKGIAAATGAPCIAVNHLEGHALTPRLSDDVAFPYLLLLVSGGHCQIVVVEDLGKYVVLGGTIDDAMGEAFDKVAKMLGLGYPGGPPVERMAKQGDATRFAFPRPLLSTPGGDFSFSGLKTAVYRSVAEWDMAAVTEQDKADVCASFQAACGDVVDDRMGWAIAQFKEGWPAGEALVVAGGVAANQYLRGRLESLSVAEGLRFVAPPMRLCTDNAAMIAWAGVERFTRGLTGGLDFAPRARWGLDVLS